jgi:hypothetical protein
MVMEFYAAAVFFFIWLIFLTWIVIKTQRHYQSLISNTNKKKIEEILEDLLEKDKRFSAQIDRLSKLLTELIQHSKMSFRKVGLVSYNPFERIGGEQSFVLAILNEYNSGFVINFIYTREGLRSYIKKVKEGKGDKYELSEEEIEAIKKST